MSNDPKADLIYAILAMDSYNRGYGSGIKNLPTNGVGAKVGSWSIITTATDELDGSFAAGIAYALRNASAVAIADLNSDGKQDLLVSNGDINGVSVLLQNNNGTLGGTADFPAGKGPRANADRFRRNWLYSLRNSEITAELLRLIAERS